MHLRPLSVCGANALVWSWLLHESKASHVIYIHQEVLSTARATTLKSDKFPRNATISIGQPSLLKLSFDDDDWAKKLI